MGSDRPDHLRGGATPVLAGRARPTGRGGGGFRRAPQWDLLHPRPAHRRGCAVLGHRRRRVQLCRLPRRHGGPGRRGAPHPHRPGDRRSPPGPVEGPLPQRRDAAHDRRADQEGPDLRPALLAHARLGPRGRWPAQRAADRQPHPLPPPDRHHPRGGSPTEHRGGRGGVGPPPGRGGRPGSQHGCSPVQRELRPLPHPGVVLRRARAPGRRLLRAQHLQRHRAVPGHRGPPGVRDRRRRAR